MLNLLWLSLASLILAVVLLVRKIHFLQLQRTGPAFLVPSLDFALLTHFPQPLLIVNGSGTILYKNKQWLHLPHPYAELTSLADFDQATGTRFNGRLRHAVGQTTFAFTLRSEAMGTQAYSAVSWPVNSSAATQSLALALFPQELAEARKEEYPRLERELLHFGRRYIGIVSEALRTSNTTKAKEGLAQMSEVFGYVTEHHKTVRTQRPHQATEPLESWRMVLATFRSRLRHLHILVTGSHSHHALVLGAREDLELLFTILLEHLTDDEVGNHFRIHQETAGEYYLFEIETDRAPELNPLQQFRLRLLHQLAVKMDGKFDASTLPHPRYRLRLRGAKLAK